MPDATRTGIVTDPSRGTGAVVAKRLATDDFADDDAVGSAEVTDADDARLVAVELTGACNGMREAARRWTHHRPPDQLRLIRANDSDHGPLKPGLSTMVAVAVDGPSAGGCRFDPARDRQPAALLRLPAHPGLAQDHHEEPLR